MVSKKEKVHLLRCRSCNSKKIKLAVKKDKFPLYIWPLDKNEKTALKNIYVYVCEDCGHIQLQEMTKEIISEIYRDKAYNIENKEEKINRLKLINESNQDKFKNKKILEIGGGRNSFLAILPNSSKKWVIDFKVDNEIRELSDGFYEGDFNDTQITQSNFDYVCMFHVLEHLNNPAKALLKIKKILKNNGKILIEVPNFEWESKYRPDYTFFHMHISLFTPESLISLMERNSFKCEKFFKKDEVLLAEFSFSKRKKLRNNYKDNINLLNFATENLKKCELKLKKIIRNMDKSETAIFGGGGSSTLFLKNFPFLIEKVQFALDNDKKKIGKYICENKIKIIESNLIDELNIKNIIILDNSHIEFFSNKDLNLINISEFYE